MKRAGNVQTPLLNKNEHLINDHCLPRRVRILVTGSSGQIGSYVVDDARRRSWETAGLDLRPSAWTTHVGDVRSREDCDRAMAGCDVVVHLAAQISVQGSFSDPRNDLDHNAGGTISVLDAARRHDLKRLVLASSAVVYGAPASIPIREDAPNRPLSPYGLSKSAAEEYARLYSIHHGIEVEVVRPFNVYSPRQDAGNPYTGVLSKFASRVTEGKPPIIFGDGGQSRDFVHASDVARVIVELCRLKLTSESFDILNVGTGVETSVRELAAAFLRAAGSNLQPVFEKTRPGEIRRSVADVTKLRQAGLSPRISILEGIDELLAATLKPGATSVRRAETGC